VEAAARSAGLDERERAEVAAEAANREAAKLRAQERERIAREAAEAVRRQREQQEATARAAQARAQQERGVAEAEAKRQAAVEAGRVAAQQARLREEQEKGWLRRAAALVDRDPATLCLVCAKTDYGRRVLINPTPSRYDRDHLSDWNVDTNRIKTVRVLVGKKSDLIAFSAEFHAAPVRSVLSGADYTWDTEEAKEEATCQAN
jgi:hypothetical protein